MRTFPRYRIVFRNDHYYPQRKGLFFWSGLATFGGDYGYSERRRAVEDIEDARVADFRARNTPRIEEVK